MKRKITSIFIALALLLIGAHVFGVDVAFAQQDSLDLVADEAGIQGETDVRLVIANIINIVLSFLGVIAVIIVLYGGFTWMTAGGNADKVDRAKKILINGVIGLTVILMSWIITTFVITALGDATGIGTGGTGTDDGGGGGPGLGGSPSASFVISDVVPQGETPLRNVLPFATFSRNLDPDSVDSESFRIVALASEEVVPGSLEISGNKITFTPDEACPSPNESYSCFESFEDFRIEITSAIQSSTGADLLECLTTCTFVFQTGDIIDTEDPTVNFTLPDSGDDFPTGGLVDLQVEATDDFAVGVADFDVEDTLFDAVAASGDDLSDVIIDAVWDSVDPVVAVEGDRLTLGVTVTDLAGNTDSDTVVVDAKPAHCFNGTTDGDETGIDCGGSCGACDGGSCSNDDECAGGLCSGGQCISPPEIADVLPRNGAPGTYVTITGTDFGSITGDIFFTGLDGALVEATIPSCADGWSGTEIIVEVPLEAVDGPITLVTSLDLEDATNDDNGPMIEDFDVNDVKRPALCRVSPTSGGVGAFVDLIGDQFGTEIDLVQFTDEDDAAEDVRTYNSWLDGAIEVVVPALQEGIHQVQVTVDGATSNPVNYTVVEQFASAPAISSIDPESGGPGQYVTIVGNDFGSSIGLVWFENLEDGNRTIADTSFPNACSTDFWDDDSITVKVPDVSAEQYNVFVERASDAVESNRVNFSVSTAPPGPGICSVDPEIGAGGEEVTIVGENFGSTEGTLEFYNSVGATVSSWEDEEIIATVPGVATTGPLAAVNTGDDRSNEINFEVSGEAVDTSQDFDAAYVWNFSTGEIPVTPRLVQACDAQDVSAVPSSVYNSEVCVNAVVYGYFDTLMTEATINSGAVTLESCTDVSCTVTTAVPLNVIVSSSTDQTTFVGVPQTPTQRLDTSTRYQVTVSTAVESDDGTPMANPASWQFVTSDSSLNCDIETVKVNPGSETLTAEGQETEFSAVPIADECIVLNADEYSWQWDVDPSIASFTEGCFDEEGDSCITLEALAEGESLVEASSTTSAVTGAADLTINFTDPYVDNQNPACQTACVNADVRASFNIGMDPGTIQQAGAVLLYECDNEFCTNTDLEVADRANCIFDEFGACTELSVQNPSNLKALTYYRVIVSGSVTSDSGVPLTRLNYGDDYSWTFLTRDDNAECAVDRVEILPPNATLQVVGESQQFSATPYGEPDSCSAAGQALNGFEYAWDWTDPIDDTSAEDADIASWVKLGGSLFDVNEDGIPNGCTNSCLAIGSEGVDAICGNGFLEVGEDCDDGNTLFGDGCSDRCLMEGSDACSQECSDSGLACTRDGDCLSVPGETCDIVGSGCCGDGSLTVGEECDDGNLINGDGCSTQCLREGSMSAGLTCGDGITTNTPQLGGEDCDDGNRSSGDGCSALCLNEGSESFSDLAAVCGNGVIETPYETCDDTNTLDGDGCSSNCLREGIAGQVSTGYDCGDGVTETTPGTFAGEDCDSTDGCSEECTWLGSSLEHASPSICGDGTPGPGEFPQCEVGLAGDGDIDPIQLAQIDDDAAALVGESGEATQVVEVNLDGVTALADLTLSCSAESDDDCPVGFGVDTNGCCSAFPDVQLHPTGSEVCLNTALYATSDVEMSASSFDGNTFLRYDGGGLCPSGHTVFSSRAYLGNNWLARVWYEIKTFFVGVVSAQSDGDCLVPLSGFTQTKQVDGSFRISFTSGTLLAENSTYSLVVLDGEDGALTATGVKLPGDARSIFNTGDEICALDVVEITDTTGDTPGLFTSFDDVHSMIATPLTQTGITQQEIQPIPGVYSWNWLSWQEDSDRTLFTVDVPGAPEESNVIPTGLNGEATLVAQAEIFEGGNSSGQVVSGSLDLFALLCENPWPEAQYFPFEDSVQGNRRTIPGIERDPDWMNFSTYYCRDSEEGDLLPDVSVASATAPGVDEVLKEYFFGVGGTTDVIGIRIASNPEFLSPLDWYNDQGFSGSPSATTVDGFEAVEDGRTIYVGAANHLGGQRELWSNIYVISYNDGATDETINVYNQMLQNWNFVVNVSNINLCLTNDGYSDEICTSDHDCSIGTCAAEADMLTRDTKRLADLTTIDRALEAYSFQNGLCSATTTQGCKLNADCPGGEVCQPSYPTIPSGSFVRSITSSAWTSWESELGTLIGNIPVDPLNAYIDCGEGSDNPDHDADTCVNQSSGVYICPTESYAYHYRSQGPFGYQLSAELEYRSQRRSSWRSNIDQDIGDLEEVQAGFTFTPSGDGFLASDAFCSNASFGDSAVCGDGIVGDGEACEVGQDGPAIACVADGGADGLQTQVCASDCSGFVTDAAAACVPFACGNGLIEVGEQCDDGSLNGSYGFCNSDCSGFDFFCGDGAIAGGEVCDCSVGIPSGLAFEGGTCSVANGEYNSNPNNSCAWDCGGAASHCGDGIVDTGEQCDGNTDTWDGKLCSGGLENGQPCDGIGDCSFGGVCGIAIWAQDCPNTNVCLSGVNEGLACANDAACPGSSCSIFTVQTTRTRVCADEGTAGDLCTWDDSGSFQNIDCRAPISCGNGTVEPGEECDGTDDCTELCTLNVCGDGYIYPGVEACDEGNENGIQCTAAYGSTCNYCSTSCNLLASSGAFCGDGVKNGGEFCDAADQAYFYYQSYDQGIAGGETFGTCDESDLGQLSGGGRCELVGACNGGEITRNIGNGPQTESLNGNKCLNSAECGGGECVFPTCANDCHSSCPFDYTNQAISFLDNQVGASLAGSISLLSSTETEDVEVLGGPNAASLFIPECRIAEKFTVDVDASDRDLPDVDIMFVVDISRSMDDVGVLSGTTPLAELQVAMLDTIDALYDAFDGVNAELKTGWTYIGDAHTNTTDFLIQELTSSESTMSTSILNNTNAVAGTNGTPIYSSIEQAWDELNNGTGDTQYMVIFTDGNIWNGNAAYSSLGETEVTYMESVTDLVDDIKADDISVFSAVLTTNDCDISQMSRWSSMECSAAALGCTGRRAEGNYSCNVPEDGLTYSYSAETATGLQQMYESIVSSIVDININLTFGNETVSIPVEDGSSREIDFPLSFQCDPFAEQELLLNMSFLDQTGEGVVELSNPQFNFCAP